jgi:hypothetical protein
LECINVAKDLNNLDRVLILKSAWYIYLNI